jgi:hypothetical protein
VHYLVKKSGDVTIWKEVPIMNGQIIVFKIPINTGKVIRVVQPQDNASRTWILDRCLILLFNSLFSQVTINS